MRARAPGVPGFFLVAYLVGAARAEAADTFQLRIPPETTLCGSFVESRPVREVLALKSRLGLKPGVTILRGDGTSTAEVFEWLETSPGGPRLSPVGPGIWQAELFDYPPDPSYGFYTSQEFLLQGGEILRVSIGFHVSSSQTSEIILDPPALTWDISSYSIYLLAAFGPDFTRTLWFLPCTPDHLPLWTVDLRFKNGDETHFEERYHDPLDGTGSAELVLAEITLGGRKYRVEDYWRLVHTAGHLNISPRPDLLAILEESVQVAGVGKVRAVLSSEGFYGEEPRAFYLGEDLEPLAPIELSTFVRRPAGSPVPPLFRRGDVDFSGTINLTDAIRILLLLFSGAPLDCPDAADVDDFGTVGIEDPILLLGYLFLGGPSPAPPGPLVCGQEPFRDDLPDCPPGLCPN
jgi:hypothetical protein